MDVERGHCWRCEKILPKSSRSCSDCPLAEYCTTSCRKKDRVRHGCVECKVFGPKKCGQCNRTGIMKECASCNGAWYCSKECQIRNWQQHKQSCKEVRASIKSIASNIGKLHITLGHTERTSESPFYFGNTIAKDYLRLHNNEWFGKEEATSELSQDYHVLSVGCGDLRYTVLTAASLPPKYQGKLHITLNDFDAFVMARNIFFLHTMVRFADTEGIESSLATIWYSTHIPKKEYDLIKTSLDELIHMDAGRLQDVTNGLLSVQEPDMRFMRQVWKGWRALECKRDNELSINLRRQRQLLCQNDFITGLPIYLDKFAQKDEPLLEKWFDHGLFLPSESEEGQLPFDNPTLTGRTALLTERDKEIAGRNPSDHLELRAPEDYKFVYCVKPDTFPFSTWDCLRVRESETRRCSSPMVMYHNYVTSLLQRVKSVILQGRLLVHVFLANCLDFPNHHLTLEMPNYDRIFTSNLADYVGFAQLITTFKPLLNSSNSFSCIVTETMNWFLLTPGADVTHQQLSQEYRASVLACLADTHNIGIGWNPREYFNSTPHFLTFLRADIMGGGIGIKPFTDVPSLKTAMEYNGMKMRDFRKELNRIVPFQYRVTARDFTMMNGADRAVEWYLPPN